MMNKSSDQFDHGSASSEPSYDQSWITSFVAQKGHEFLCEVEESYVEQKFNLFGIVENTFDRTCVKLILDEFEIHDTAHLDHDTLRKCQDRAVEIFTQVHQRFILTTRGLKLMEQKYRNQAFGECPMIECQECGLLPHGMENELGRDTVKLFCPCCERIYHPPRARHRDVDGAFWGNNFANLFLITYPQYKLEAEPGDKLPLPRVFGLLVHPDAYAVNYKDQAEKLRKQKGRNSGRKALRGRRRRERSKKDPA